MQHSRRIVITGMGVVSPLGCGSELTWRRLLAGHSGIRPLPEAWTRKLQVRVGGLVPDLASDPEGGWNPTRVIEAKELRRMDRFIPFALDAADQALREADWPEADIALAERCATVIASGIGGFGAIAEAVRTTDARGADRLSPFTVPSFLINLAAGHVSIRHGLKGPLGAPVTACAAGVQAIGDAMRLIRGGEADAAVCGGSEAAVHPVSLGAFESARTLSSGHADAPERASRPFDRDRDGFVMSEGAAILVIEALDHALARGAHPLAELVGYGTSADAYHITAGPEDGEGAWRAMSLAIRDAELQAIDIDLINAHATSTPVGDRSEIEAIKSMFGVSKRPALTATKAATGHLLGAAGSLAAVFAVHALREQIAPPILNLENPDQAAAGFDFVTLAPRPLTLEHVMVNGFGFGGVNASLVLRRWA